MKVVRVYCKAVMCKMENEKNAYFEDVYSYPSVDEHLNCWIANSINLDTLCIIKIYYFDCLHEHCCLTVSFYWGM